MSLSRGARLQPEGVRPRFGLGEGVGTEQVGGEAGHVALLDVVTRPLAEQCIDQGVLDVHEDRDRGVDRRQLLDGEDGHQQIAAGTAVGLGDVDAHEPELKTPREQRRIDGGSPFHRGHSRPDVSFSEVPDGVAEQLFFFGELGEWGGAREFRHRGFPI